MANQHEGTRKVVGGAVLGTAIGGLSVEAKGPRLARPSGPAPVLSPHLLDRSRGRPSRLRPRRRSHWPCRSRWTS